MGQEGIGAPCNIYVYVNQGTDSAPVFADSTPVLCNGSVFNNWRVAVVTEDLDRDGRKDLVMGEWYSSVRFYRNEGTNPAPVFNSFNYLVMPDSQSFVNGNPPRINFCDWDGDTDRDMITCDYYGSVFLRRNATLAVKERSPQVISSQVPGATIVRGMLWLRGWAGDGALLLDAAGRTVMNLTPGSNDVGRLRSGVYFVSSISRGGRLKLVLQN